MRYDIVVLGSGPAGLSAAVAARGRNKSVLVVGNRWQDSPLARAECVDNYLGLPSMTGAELMDRFTRHAEESGANLVTGTVISQFHSIRPPATEYSVLNWTSSRYFRVSGVRPGRQKSQPSSTAVQITSPIPC